MIETHLCLDDPRLDVFLRLTDVELRSRFEPEKGIFIAESEKIVDRALSAGYEPLALLLPTRRLDKNSALLARLELVAPDDFPVFVAPDHEIEKIVGFELTRGVLCAFRRKKLLPAKQLLRGATRIAVIEDVTNYTNIGALFRSAAALGIDAVLVTPGCCDPLYRRALRVSMGTTLQVPWTRIGENYNQWPVQGLELLSELGFVSVALALRDDSIGLDDPRLKEFDKIALIFGTEGQGLKAQTLDRCDYIVKIPMEHGVDSLNVAAASAVAFWELCAK